MSIETKINEIDWSSFNGPEGYDASELIEALVHLNIYDESKAKNGLDNKVLFAVGNNHRGTCYPAILAAADIIIEIERSSAAEDARKCAFAILNNLYYFEPEIGTYTKHGYKEIADFVKEKLKPYSDETL